MFAITLVISLLFAVFANAHAFAAFGLPAIFNGASSSTALPGSTADSAPARTITARAAASENLITTLVPQTTISTAVVGYWNTHCNNTHFHIGTGPCDCGLDGHGHVPHPTGGLPPPFPIPLPSGVPHNSANVTIAPTLITWTPSLLPTGVFSINTTSTSVVAAATNTTLPTPVNTTIPIPSNATTPTNSSIPSAPSSICPAYDNQAFTDGSGAAYNVFCNTAFEGDTVSWLTKRDDGVSDEDCMSQCDAIDECIAMMTSEGNCFLFSTVDDEFEYDGVTGARKVPSTVSSSSSSSSQTSTRAAASTGIPHNSANETASSVRPTGGIFPTGGFFPTGGIFPTGHFPRPTITAPASIPLVSVSGGYIPINTNFTGPYFNPHCPGNATHVHHGTEPCDCGDDDEPTAMPSSGMPINSANATRSVPLSTGIASPLPSSGFPVISPNSTTHAYMTGTGFPRPPITTVPLTSVSGGYIPINHNFTVPYFNPHCPGNATHVHHGTEPCDCADDHDPTTTPGPSSGFPVNSANSTISHAPSTTAVNTTSSSAITTSSTADPVPRPSSGMPINSANSTTSRFMTGTAPSPTFVSLTSVSGGYIPINHNFTVPYYNPHCPDNPNHVHHGTGPCDCVDEPTAVPSSGFPVNSANSTTSRVLTGTAPSPRPTTVSLTSVSGGYIPINSNFSAPYVNTHCPNNPGHVHHGTEPCDCVDEPTAAPSSGFPINSANATTTRTSTASTTTTSSTVLSSATSSSILSNTTVAHPTVPASNTSIPATTSMANATTASITSVSLTSVSGGYIPVQSNFTLPYINTYCPKNTTHIHHGTEVCDCIDDDEPTPTPTPSRGFSVSANATTPGVGPTAYPGLSHSHPAVPTTAPPAISLTSVSGGYIPVHQNFTGSYINTHCPGNSTHVHHGTEPCDCIDDHSPTSSLGLNMTVSATTTSSMPIETIISASESSTSSVAVETSISSTSSTSAAPSSTYAPVCPLPDGTVFNDDSDVDYSVSCDTSYTGTTITPLLRRRSMTDSAQECMMTCDTIDACIAITYAPGQCTLFSDISGTSASPGATSAKKVPQVTSTSSTSSTESSSSSTFSTASTTSMDASTTSAPAPSLTSVSGGYVPIDGNFTGSYINTHCPGNSTHVHYGTEPCDCDLDQHTAPASIDASSTIPAVSATSTESAMVTSTTSSTPSATASSPFGLPSASPTTSSSTSSSSSSASSASSSSTISSTSTSASSTSVATTTTSMEAVTTLAPVVSLTSVPGGYIPADPSFTGSYINTMCSGNHTHIHHGTEPCDCGEDLPQTSASLTESTSVPTVSASATQTTSSSSAVSTSSSSAPVPTSTASTSSATSSSLSIVSTSSSSSHSSTSTKKATTTTKKTTSTKPKTTTTSVHKTSPFHPPFPPFWPTKKPTMSPKPTTTKKTSAKPTTSVRVTTTTKPSSSSVPTTSVPHTSVVTTSSSSSSSTLSSSAIVAPASSSSTTCTDEGEHTHTLATPSSTRSSTLTPSFPTSTWSTVVSTSKSSSSSTLSTSTLSSATSSSGSSSSPTPSAPAVCPGYDGKMYSDSNGAQYSMACDTAYSGTTIPAKYRRASSGTVQDCMTSCDSIDACIAITYVGEQCSLLSSVSGSAKVVGATAAYKASALKTSTASTSSTPSTLAATTTAAATTTTPAQPTTTPKPSSTFSTLTKPFTSTKPAATSTASQTPTVPAGANPDWLPSDVWGQIMGWFGQGKKPSGGNQGPPAWSPWGGSGSGSGSHAQGYRAPNGKWIYKKG